MNKKPAEPQGDAQLKFKVQSLIGCAGDICWPCSHRTDEIVGLIQAAEQRATRAALERAAKLFDDGKAGHWHYGEISRLIRALIPADSAPAQTPSEEEGRK